MKDFKFIDLCAGIGGMRIGFESVGGKCVFSNDYDKFAAKTYIENHGDNDFVLNDIRGVDINTIPEHDMLVAGFPCQPFSSGGISTKKFHNQKHGFECDTQGTIFFSIAKIIEKFKPKAFFLENVKNLKSHDKGKTFKIIERTLVEDLGYNISYKVIDAKSFVPQHRERIFIVGFKEQNDYNICNTILPDKNKGPRLNTVLHDTVLDEEHPYTKKRGVANDKYILSDKMWSWLRRHAEKHKDKGNGFGYSMFDENDVARTLSARYYKDGSEVIIKTKDGMNPRKLTPRECGRLMGYENDFKIPVSDTQSYKQFGNSVVPPLIKHLAKDIVKYL